MKINIRKVFTQVFFQGKKGNVLFNDTFNTFYLWLYGVWHMVHNHLDSERKNLLPQQHGLFFLISSMGSFICTSNRLNSIHHGLCYTGQGGLAGMKNSSMGPQWGINLMTHHTMSWCSTMELHLAHGNFLSCFTLDNFVFIIHKIN